jgi:SAM-dependent MidA family methyltransferase
VAVVRRGVVIVVDYADDVAASGDRDWIRTYGGHARGTDALAAPGTVDITADVPLDALRGLAAREGFRVESEMTQAEWLRGLRIDELVDEGRRIWHERAHLGDLVAVEGRSRVTEADALLDLTGLGAHRVIVLTKGTFADGGQAIA